MFNQDKYEILLGLTTTPASDWRAKVQEMKKFGIKRIALFPTFLDIEKRKELYALLAEIENLEIPHVHLRGTDMEGWEMDLFEQKYQTKVYNIHEEFFTVPLFEKYAEKIGIENRYWPVDQKALEKFPQICLDLAHMHDGKLRKNSRYETFENYIQKYPVVCCHISAIKTCKWNPLNWYFGFDRHYLKNLKELDYAQNYKQYLPKFISLELENSFEQQLEVKKYLEQKLFT